MASRPGAQGRNAARAPEAARQQVSAPARKDWSDASRQVGNAFPPPVACAVGESIRQAILADRRPARISAWLFSG
jgi:hypothetical protein